VKFGYEKRIPLAVAEDMFDALALFEAGLGEDCDRQGIERPALAPERLLMQRDPEHAAWVVRMSGSLPGDRPSGAGAMPVPEAA
jgi:hypothetical protein